MGDTHTGVWVVRRSRTVSGEEGGRERGGGQSRPDESQNRYETPRGQQTEL